MSQKNVEEKMVLDSMKLSYELTLRINIRRKNAVSDSSLAAKNLVKKLNN